MDKVRLGVLVSGSGSNLQSIIDHIEQGLIEAEIRVVISSNPDAFALERAGRHGIPAETVIHADFADREAFDRKLVEILRSRSVDLVVLAGFMRVLSPYFLREFRMRVMNIHPALLPSFPGLHGQKKAFDYGVKFSGCTVHFADEGVDTGPIIIQAVVPVLDDDTEDTLAERILKEEHRIYPQAIQYFAQGRLTVSDRKVRVSGVSGASGVMHNPPLSI
ncbi:MAG: phosphoribosylglycinamide formyltransferase [Syntrophales bacterium]|nr:phosphoribosylglycinamide formyltransferase [Syntrophales bacterium]MDD5532868.1 phosphoribosylglycinamide formyltransferase [Syntrophales bacterium]